MNERNKDRATDQSVLSASIPKLLKKQINEAAVKKNQSTSKWLTETLTTQLSGGNTAEGLSPGIKQKIAVLALDVGLPTHMLLEIAAKGLLDYSAAHNGKLPLPLDFTTAWTQLKSIVEEAEKTPQYLHVADDPTPYTTKKNKKIVDPAQDEIDKQNANGGDTSTGTA